MSLVKRERGFTLMELMIVVAIIAILATIAYGSYQAYVIKGNRTDMQTQMLQIASRLESYKLVNGSYQGALLSNTGIYGSATYPVGTSAKYNLAATALVLTDNNSDGKADAWVLTATPIATSVQKSDGVVCLNNNGYRFWQKGATACALSSTSTWKE